MTHEIGILFAPRAKFDNKNELDDLFNEVKLLLKGRNLGDLITIKRLPPNVSITNTKDAERVRELSRANLLIWGSYEKGKINKEEYIGFTDKIYFTYKIPTYAQNQKTSSDIAEGISNRLWMFSTSNELIERKLITKNIVDVSRYIIGSSLLYFGNLTLSKTFLGEIIIEPHGTWRSHGPSSFVEFYLNIKKKLSFIDAEFARLIYTNNVFVDGVFNLDPELLAKIESYANTSINNLPTINAYLLKSIAMFLQNRTKKSIECLTKTKKRWPSNPNPDYSLAFLYAYNGDLRISKSHYRRAFRLTTSRLEADIFHLVGFQEAYLEVDCTRYHLYFTLGLLYYELIDEQLSIDNFQKFIDSATAANNPKDLTWINESRKIISTTAERVIAGA